MKDRNETAHSNGNIFFSTKAELAAKIHEIVRIVTEIQSHSEAIIVDGYKRFLLDSADPEEREHIDAIDHVREILIHENYMSLIDLDFCAKFNVEEFANHDHFAEMQALHAEVQAWVRSEEMLAA